MSTTALLIAVIDDEEPIRRALERLMRSAGFAVETYPGGEAFLDSLQSHQPDCIVLDLHMPAMSGFELQSRLTAARVQIPTVVITGHDSPESRKRALSAGAAAFLRKPVDGQALLDTITNVIEHGTGDTTRPVNQ